MGSLCFVVGHAVLKLTDIPIYDLYSINSSARVGAAGGAVVSFPFVLIAGAISDLPQEIQGGMDAVLSVLFILSSVGVGHQLMYHANQPVMEILDYVKAALVGQAVLGAAFGLAFLMMALTCGIGCSMGWLTYLRIRKRTTRGEKDARGSAFDLEGAAGSRDDIPPGLAEFFNAVLTKPPQK